MEDHLDHLRVALEVLGTNQLYAKQSKCRFGCLEVDYLGDLISAEGVRAYPKKLKAMLDFGLNLSL